MRTQKRTAKDVRMIKSALRSKVLESTDPVYITHRRKILGLGSDTKPQSTNANGVK